MDQLPPELLCHVASFLDVDEIIALRRTHVQKVVGAILPVFAKTVFQDDLLWKQKWLSTNTLDVLEGVASQPAFVPYVTQLCLNVQYLVALREARAQEDQDRTIFRNFVEDEIRYWETSDPWIRLRDVLCELSPLEKLHAVYGYGDELWTVVPRLHPTIPAQYVGIRVAKGQRDWVTGSATGRLYDAIQYGNLQVKDVRMRPPALCLAMMGPVFSSVKILRFDDLIDWTFGDVNKALRDATSLTSLTFSGRASTWRGKIDLNSFTWPPLLQELYLTRFTLNAEHLAFIARLPPSMLMLEFAAMDFAMLADGRFDYLPMLSKALRGHDFGMRFFEVSYALRYGDQFLTNYDGDDWEGTIHVDRLGCRVHRGLVHAFDECSRDPADWVLELHNRLFRR